MLYQKKFVFRAPKQIELSISDFKNGINTEIAENIMPYKFATNSYNYNFENGALIEGLGFDDLKVPQSPDDPSVENIPILPMGKEIDCIWHFKHYDTYQNKRMDKLMLYTKDKLVYYATMFSPLPMFFLVPNINFTSRPTALNYKLNGKDYVILTSNTDSFVIWDGESMPQVITSAPELSSICVHQDKLFATIGGQRNIVRYSSNLDPTTWTKDLTNPNNPYIELNDARGGVNKVISFLGYVFAFREFGITKIKTYENSSEINVSHLFVSGNRIYKNTICICGDRILMLTKDGIYEFDGISTKKVDLKIDALFQNIYNDQAVASYHEGKYYVACKLSYPDNNVIGCENVVHSNDTLIELDVKTHSFHIIRGVDVVSMTSLQVDSMSKMAFCFNSVYANKLGELTKNGKFFEDNTVKHWYSPMSDLGYPATQKLIKELSLLTKYDCNITLFTERQTVTFAIKGKNTNSKIKPNIKGELIGIKVESLGASANISNAKLKLLVWQN
ncbi:MAG: hypothetical protein CVV59_00875 [Tenericutes bacterium HGW-Tenericutes-4]|nr:MAG: hypothetical protein CVV59_00875 [Tenericutes bacterium HGW-Tenericutes-4]